MDDTIQDIIAFNIELQQESYIYISNIPLYQIQPKHDCKYKQNIDDDQDIDMKHHNHDNDDDDPFSITTIRPNTPNTNPNENIIELKIEEDKISKVVDVSVLLLGYLAEKFHKHRNFLPHLFDNNNHYKMISLGLWFLRITKYWDNKTVQHNFFARWQAHGFVQQTMDDIKPFAENLTNETALQFLYNTQWEPKEMMITSKKENITPVYGYNCCSWCGSNNDEIINRKHIDRKYDVKKSNVELRILMQGLMSLISSGIDVRMDIHKKNVMNAAQIMNVTKNEVDFVISTLYQQVAMLQFLMHYL